jgi:hypothetical protein
MKNRFKVATVLAVAVALVGVTAGPALADQGEAVIGSQAYYQAAAAKQLSVQDTQSDGKSAVGEIKNAAGTVFELTESAGSGHIAYRSVSVVKGSTIQIRAGVQNLSTGTAAVWGPWRSTTA